MFDIFKRKAERIERLDAAVAELENVRGKLLDEIAELTSKNKQLTLEKKMSDEDIAHMVKMSEEVAALEKQKYVVQIEGEKSEAILKVKDEYRDKLEEFLKTQIKDGKDAYEKILSRLPDVNVKLSGKVG